MRGLIVNADDLGLCEGVNSGIVRAHDDGIVTSASLMVRQPAAREAVALSATRPALSLGLHLDLGEWVYRDETWIEAYAVIDLDDPAAIEAEVVRQLEQFRELTGRAPTHLDSHQHVHGAEPTLGIVRKHAAKLNVPLRGDAPEVTYCGSFYGHTGTGEPIDGALSVEALIGLLGELPPGVTELGCHPGQLDGLDSDYAEERLLELETLCDLRVKEALSEGGIHLLSFARPRF